ncbi:hypothetical protein B5V89_14805 [Heyndrickxia sporothermodurans]|uniref:hypothetical protein n=1 Tax=Heyndrickxia sporothermodurans TaxID=46224 RepID=UPI000D3A1431|nr:hypothetical protein [Heyndrickxia sporothermodurans]PTY77348.1 hypothetical protein B5V89_14805 [Heyndrickxia sporothermodurans]
MENKDIEGIITQAEKALKIAKVAIADADDAIEKSQLDRIEKKMDRILELLESKETSISVKTGFLNIPTEIITYKRASCRCVRY